MITEKDYLKFLEINDLIEKRIDKLLSIDKNDEIRNHGDKTISIEDNFVNVEVVYYGACSYREYYFMSYDLKKLLLDFENLQKKACK